MVDTKLQMHYPSQETLDNASTPSENTHTTTKTSDGNAASSTLRSLSLRDTYFVPELLHQPGSMEALMWGLLEQPAQELDVHVVNDLRNFLFGGSKHSGDKKMQ